MSERPFLVYHHDAAGRRTHPHDTLQEAIAQAESLLREGGYNDIQVFRLNAAGDAREAWWEWERDPDGEFRWHQRP